MSFAIIVFVICALTLSFIAGFIFVRWRNSPTSKRPQAIVDTSILMDGRLLKLIETGFIAHELLIPSFVLTELRQIADNNKDKQRRIKAKAGLELLSSLKKKNDPPVTVFDPSQDNLINGVDDNLIKLAKENNLYLFSNDYNLLQVAKAQGIKTLSINELAISVRFAVLPKEDVELKIVDTGEQKKQGVGYLHDGTMVIVSGAAKYVGRRLIVTVKKVRETPSGRMLFAEVKSVVKPKVKSGN